MRRTCLCVLLLASVQPSEATTNVSSSQRQEVDDYIARTFPQLCPYEPLCYQNAKKPANGNMGSCCLPCSCHDHCHLLSNCCPDKQLGTEESTRGKSLSADMFKCTSSKIGPSRDTEYYSMVTKCPLRTATPDLGVQCESRDNPPVSALIPVTDLETGITYRNVHCSQCHGVAGGVPWSTSVHCDMNMLQTIEYGEFSSISIILSDLCDMYLGPPTGIDVESDRCDPMSRDTCNATGLWRPDGPTEMIAEACKTWRNVYFSYRNIYCYLCDARKLPEDKTCRISSRVPVTQTSFTATLKFGSDAPDGKTEDATDKDAVCQAGYVMDTYLVRVNKNVTQTVGGATTHQILK